MQTRTLLLALSVPALLLQTTPDMDRLLSYLQPAPGFSAAQRDTAWLLARRFNDSTLSDGERLAATRDLARLWLLAVGSDTASVTGSAASLLTRASRGGYRFGPAFDYPAAEPGRLTNVIVRGKGPVPVILIPEFRKTWEIFAPFMDANSDRFTSYAFSLPGYGGTLPAALPLHADYGARAWLENVVQAVEHLIVERGLDRPLLVGSMSAGVYVAIRVARRRPDLTRGVVALNGALHAGDDAASVTQSATDRAAAVARNPIVLLSTVFTREAPTSDSVARLATRPINPRSPIHYYARDSVMMRRIFAMHLSFRPFLERYYFEWLTADLRDDVAALRVPLLSVPGIADDEAPQRGDHSTLQQWTEFQRQHPSANVTISPMEGVRGLVAVDAPEASGRLIVDWLMSPAMRR